MVASEFSGLQPGNMVWVEGRPYEDTAASQCYPFNPFYEALIHDRFVWAIVVCDKDNVHALRPRRAYYNDEARVIDTIEGLCSYPESYVRTLQYNKRVECRGQFSDQGISKSYIYDNGVVVGEVWIHNGVLRTGNKAHFFFGMAFDAPIEYMVLNRYLESFNGDEYNGGIYDISRMGTFTGMTPTPEGPRYDFIPPKDGSPQYFEVRRWLIVPPWDYSLNKPKTELQTWSCDPTTGRYTPPTQWVSWDQIALLRAGRY